MHELYQSRHVSSCSRHSPTTLEKAADELQLRGIKRKKRSNATRITCRGSHSPSCAKIEVHCWGLSPACCRRAKQVVAAATCRRRHLSTPTPASMHSQRSHRVPRQSVHTPTSPARAGQAATSTMHAKLRHDAEMRSEAMSRRRSAPGACPAECPAHVHLPAAEVCEGKLA